MLQGFALGRIGKDAELRATDKGTAVSNFSLAVEIGWGEHQKTVWIDCVLWGKSAETLTLHLTKGKQIAVLGELDVRAWIGRQDNEPHGQIQMNVSEVAFCGSKKGAGA